MLDGWPGSAAVIAERAPLAGGNDSGPPVAGPPPQPSGAAALLSLEAMVDSAFLWALCSAAAAGGRAWTPRWPGRSRPSRRPAATGRFNFLLTDGRSVAATACGDTLWYRLTGDGRGLAASVMVASEP